MFFKFFLAASFLSIKNIIFFKTEQLFIIINIFCCLNTISHILKRNSRVLGTFYEKISNNYYV